MSMMSSALTFTFAITRARTQSKPLSLGERAQDGTPITGTSPSAPNIIRLPGSTGMPRCNTLPPARVTAMGITSPRSVMADAPNTRMGSQPEAFMSVMAAVTCAMSCSTTRTEASVPPRAEIRSCIASSDLATIVGLVCGKRVMTNPARLSRNAATRTSGSVPMMASAFSRTSRGTAKGITFTVATISRSSTMAKG